VNFAPSAVPTCHRLAVSSQAADVTVVLNLMLSVIPQATACAPQVVEYLGLVWRIVVSNLGFCAKENEYSGAGMSHAHPGYVFSRHVPPTSSPCSTTM